MSLLGTYKGNALMCFPYSVQALTEQLKGIFESLNPDNIDFSVRHCLRN